MQRNNTPVRQLRGLERLDAQIVEPGVALPAIEGKIALLGPGQGTCVLEGQEGRLHVVDVPGDGVALALDFPVVALANFDLGCRSLHQVFARDAMLIAASQERLAVVPSAHHGDIASCLVLHLFLGSCVALAIAEELHFDVAV